MTALIGAHAVLTAASAHTFYANQTTGASLLAIDGNGATDVDISAEILAALDFDPDPNDCGTHYSCEDCLDLDEICALCTDRMKSCDLCASLRAVSSESAPKTDVQNAPAASAPLGIEMPPSPFVDVAAALAGNLVVPKPSIGRRTDGQPLFYRAATNVIVGDPESGKSLLARSVAAEVLVDGGSVVWCDLDHNGISAILAGFRAWGVPEDVLSDPRRFRLAVVDDRAQMDNVIVIATMTAERPDLFVLDSIGELVGLYEGDQNSDADYTSINRRTMARVAAAGACVIAIDHLAKGTDSRAYGASGSVAKKRAVDGVMLRVDLARPFVPGGGGRARLLIVKDRHGGVRECSPGGGKTPLAASFELQAGAEVSWRLWAPTPAGDHEQSDDTHAARLAPDVQTLADMTPPPSSRRDVQARTNWGTDRALRALAAWRSAF